MPKICEAPPYEGGQSIDIYYNFTFTQTIVDSGWGNNHFAGQNSRQVTRTDIGNVIRGKVVSIEQGVFFNHSTFKVTNSFGESVIANSGGGDYQYFFSGFGGVYTTYSYSNIRFTRQDGQTDTGGNPPSNCECSSDSCRVDCADAPDGFCCIDHALTDRLLDVLQV